MFDFPASISMMETGNDIETRALAPSARAFFVQPGAGSANDTRLLVSVHSEHWRAVSGAAPRFDFDKHGEWAARCDEVEFDAARPHVASNDAIASRFEVLSSAGFAARAECTSGVSCLSGRIRRFAGPGVGRIGSHADRSSSEPRGAMRRSSWDRGQRE